MSRTIGSIGSLPLLLHTTGYPPIGTTSRLLVDPGRSVQTPTVHQPHDWQEARVNHFADPDRHCRRSDRIRPILLRCTWSAFGTKRTSRLAQSMSAFGGKADIPMSANDPGCVKTPCFM